MKKRKKGDCYRYEQLRNSASPEELSFAVWTKELEKAMQSSRDCYRKPFVRWINEYASGDAHTGWQYNTPRELAEAIWNLYPDDTHFENLRQTLTTWIEQYKKRIDKLIQRLENLKTRLDIELRRENKVIARRTWGYAQRNIKLSFSTRKSDNLKERIDKIESELNKLKTV